MARYRIEYSFGGDIIVEVPSDYTDDDLHTCVINALGRIEDDVPERFADEIEDSETIGDCIPASQFTITKVSS